jgi:UBX domain-containing protein 1
VLIPAWSVAASNTNKTILFLTHFQAQNALGAANWDLSQAVALYFAAHENASDDEDDDDEPTHSTAPAQPAASSSSSGRKPPASGRSKQMKTLADLGGEDDEDEKDPAQDMFAGGEKSGLAVQNPDQATRPADHFRNIMNQARSNRERPQGEDDDDVEEQPRSSHFAGRAQTLGGDDVPSQVVQDPAAAAAASRPRHPRVTRTLHLWADGVSIDDGPLLRFDDPANEHIMQEINQGRAPKALLDVQPDQEVDLNLEPHKGENYVAPKPKYKPFGGQGQRLGSPTPGLAPPTSAAPTSSSATTNTSDLAATTAAPPTMLVDDSQPTLQLQIRLGDGTRLVSRFNTSHTIGDVYDFVNRAAPTSQQRPWALMTTFPSKELEDKSQVLGDIGDFKRGGVVVQKWK